MILSPRQLVVWGGLLLAFVWLAACITDVVIGTRANDAAPSSVDAAPLDDAFGIDAFAPDAFTDRSGRAAPPRGGGR